MEASVSFCSHILSVTLTEVSGRAAEATGVLDSSSEMSWARTSDLDLEGHVYMVCSHLHIVNADHHRVGMASGDDPTIQPADSLGIVIKGSGPEISSS